ncbi:uncharacterized protein LOC142318866 isoform X2 [Lycorma delicatula]|uniref:uncharacterized protein LOC142318866 isoform X2 n=1 Tax=Lycorma delicatula TaxID=130591 RepID=UPI003F5157B2
MHHLCVLLYFFYFPQCYNAPVLINLESRLDVPGNESNGKEKDGIAPEFNSSPTVTLPNIPVRIPIQQLKKQENEPEKKNITLQAESKIQNQSSELLNGKSETQLYKPAVVSVDQLDLKEGGTNADIYVSENNNTVSSDGQFFCNLCACPPIKSYNPERCKLCPPCSSLNTEPFDVVNNNQYNDNNNNYERTNSSVVETSVKEEAVNSDDITYDAQEINENDEHVIAVGHSHDKMRYILKDAIIMLTTPVLLFLSIIICRKAKHLCQRRHYIRSTYLIDGCRIFC